jgi:hypothetical protein
MMPDKSAVKYGDWGDDKGKYPRFRKLLTRARKTNRERDAIDHQMGFGAPGDCPAPIRMRTAMEALRCGMEMQDWNCVAEAFDMIECYELTIREAPRGSEMDNGDDLSNGEFQPLDKAEVIDYYIEMCAAIWDGLLPHERPEAVKPIYGHLCLNAMGACLARVGILGKHLPDNSQHREQLKVFLLRSMSQWLRDHPGPVKREKDDHEE